MPASATDTDGAVASEYKSLATDRTAALNRAYENAELTIPALLPRTRGTNTKLPRPYQSLGAHGVNNLGSKLLMTVLPANAPHFRLRPTSKVTDDAAASDDPAMMTKIEDKLSRLEREAMESIETSGDRVVIHETMLHLLVTGNGLLNVAKDGTRLYHLDRFVIKRDPEGRPLKMIAWEEVTPDVLPEAIQPRINEELGSTQNYKSVKTVDLYTCIRTDGKFHRVHQEVNGMAVPESHGTYPVERSPWIPLRFSRIDGEDYGRAFIDGLYGDLHSAEYLTKAIVEGALAAAKVLFFVRPGGTTRIDTVTKSNSGDVRAGHADDVSVLQMDKFADFRVAKDTLDTIETRLARAFLMNSSVQRDAERVTREEIRFMAQELETGLGGFYSILSEEFQLPYTRRRLDMLPSGRRLPKGLVRPAIVTGLEALGRGNDLDKLDTLLAGAIQTLGPQVVAAELNVNDYLSRRALAIGIEVEGLFKTEEQKAALRDQDRMTQMTEKLGPEAMRQAGKMNAQGAPSDG